MRIGINGYEAVVPRFGFDAKTGLPNRVGSGEFCYQLLVSLAKIDKTNEYFIFLPKAPTSDMPKESSNWHYVVFSGKLWTLWGLSKKLMNYKDRIDVFFSPTHYLPFVSARPSAIAILDVSYLHFPELFKKKDLYQLKLWGKFSIGKAKKIITISKASKNDIIKEYGAEAEKVAVVYPGIKFHKRNMNENVITKYGLKKNYILFVGTLQPRKNIKRLIEAFSKIKNKNIKLIIVGRKGWMWEEILEAPSRFDVSERVVFLDNVGDDELPEFYKNASCFILPSLYEGFGLPILEAMKYGCPVLTSNVSSLPEAGGDAAVYFDPEDVNDIAEKIEKVLSSEKLRKDLIKLGKEQVEKFSWDKSARETLEVLKDVVSKNG